MINVKKVRAHATLAAVHRGLISAFDRLGNVEADTRAKRAARDFGAAALCKRLDRFCLFIQRLGRWIGTVCVVVDHQDVQPIEAKTARSAKTGRRRLGLVKWTFAVPRRRHLQMQAVPSLWRV